MHSVTRLACFLAAAALAAAFTEPQDGARVCFGPDVRPTTIDVPANARLPSHVAGTPIKTLPAQAMAFASAHFQATFRVHSSSVSRRNNATHVYLRQMMNGLDVANGGASVHVSENRNSIVHMTASVAPSTSAPDAAPAAVSAPAALVAAAARLKVAVDASAITSDRLDGSIQLTTPALVAPAVATLVYVRTSNTEVVKAWSLIVKTDDDWADVWVDAASGDVIAVNNWVKDDSYSVFPPPTNDPDNGPREDVGFPEDAEASPLGWHDQDKGKTEKTTIGNNVYAQENHGGKTTWEHNYRPSGGKDLAFEFPLNFTASPLIFENASITNLFFLNNIIHDVFYHYGFDEESGNFQETNFNKGGLGGDAVQANAQDGAGYNNANFATPPDGERPRMRMYLWDAYTPMKDGDFENGIVIHEYGHGISNRLTGGPADSNCLGFGQSGGMGEGWSDWFSLVFRAREGDKSATPIPMGDYVAKGGIRYFPYSTDMKVNPQTFELLNDQTQYGGVHAIGSVWCAILWEVYWEVLAVNDWNPDLYKGNGGNNDIMLNVVDGMKLQPCRPNFIDARDAIIKADSLNFNGKYTCRMWKGFAKRGLGYSAEDGMSGVKEAFDLPKNCQ